MLPVDNQSLKILLIEDNLSEADLIEELLSETAYAQLELKSVQRLGEGLKCLEQDHYDIVLLDLSLPDSWGIDTVIDTKAKLPNIPIIVLTALNDRTIAVEAVRQGAQDYLVKGKLESELLIRAINYAIERQEIEKTLRQQAERERLLGQIVERIRQSLDLEEILQTTVAEVRRFLKTDRVAIYRYLSEQQGVIVAESVAEKPETDEKPNLEADIDASDCLCCIDSNCQTAEEHTTQLLTPLVERLTSQEGSIAVSIWQSEPASPIIASFTKTEETKATNQVWGKLVAEARQGSRQWQQWEREFLAQLANQVAIAIQQSELYRKLETAYRELQELATIDELTGIANRRQFEQVLRSEWQRLVRDQKPLSLVLCDIDYFKLYNDTYGHPAGDKCLQQVSQLIVQAIRRPADLVARYGGEEFAVILPDTDAYGALTIARKIHRLLADRQIPHKSSPVSLYVTLSTGIATQIPEANPSQDTLVETADRALYQAKAKGRKQIVQSQ